MIEFWFILAFKLAIFIELFLVFEYFSDAFIKRLFDRFVVEPILKIIDIVKTKIYEAKERKSSLMM